MEHLFIHCDVVYTLWIVAFRAFGIEFMSPRRVDDLLFMWRNWFGKHSLDICNYVLLRLMQLLWKVQNSCIFDDIFVVCLIGLECGVLLIVFPYKI